MERLSPLLSFPSSRKISGCSDLVSLSSSSSEDEEHSSGMEHRSKPTTTTQLLDNEALGDPTSTDTTVLSDSGPISPNPNSCGAITVRGDAIRAAEVQNQNRSSIPPQRRQEDIAYQLFDKSKLTVSDFESTGLLFAKSSEDKFNLPADELAEEVACEVQGDQQQDAHLYSTQVFHVREVVTDQPSFHPSLHETLLAPVDPGAVLEMERSARHVATDLMHVMDNLRNSLHAMTVCTKKSMQLHRESIDNVHSTVDANAKAMYTFMAKFDELNKSFTPLQQIAQQIHEMDENLKVLEKAFAKT